MSAPPSCLCCWSKGKGFWTCRYPLAVCVGGAEERVSGYVSKQRKGFLDMSAPPSCLCWWSTGKGFWICQHPLAVCVAGAQERVSGHVGTP